MAGGGWRPAAKAWLQLTGGVTALLAFDHACQVACAAAGIRFPPALIGMFVLLAAMAAREEAGEAMCVWFGPALEWIQRWMPLFYSPFLVALPRNAESLIGPQLPQVLALLAGGVAASMAATGQVVQAIQRRTGGGQQPRKAEDAEAAPPSAKQQDGPAAATASPKPVPKAVLAASWGVAAAAAFAALVAVPAGGHTAELGAAFMLSATVLSYIAGAALPLRAQTYAHPVMLCGIGANAAAAALGVIRQQSHSAVLHDYMVKGGGGAWLLKFLGVIILSFGFRLFERRRLIHRHAAAILGGIGFAVVSSLFGTALAARLLHLPPGISRALVPRSATAALALPIAESLDAPLPVTAAAVTCTGVLGAAVARMLLDKTGCTEPLARGVAAASVAHGMATAALGSAEPEALPFAALAYALAGITATLLSALPPVRWLLLAITG